MRQQQSERTDLEGIGGLHIEPKPYVAPNAARQGTLEMAEGRTGEHSAVS